jgi:serine/threonine protein phosphatase PrpC
LEQSLLQFGGDIEKCLINAYERTNEDLCDCEFDTTLSGSTAITLVIRKDYIWSANVGDSRAIVCRN